ncbi:hypothetical protein HY468_03440 [Candidatus Roizmanbacteria bacterium]|nr:hypothetical protein [Candidatus Roizmanbacteria bacterium]
MSFAFYIGLCILTSITILDTRFWNSQFALFIGLYLYARFLSALFVLLTAYHRVMPKIYMSQLTDYQMTLAEALFITITTPLLYVLLSDS